VFQFHFELGPGSGPVSASRRQPPASIQHAGERAFRGTTALASPDTRPMRAVRRGEQPSPFTLLHRGVSTSGGGESSGRKKSGDTVAQQPPSSLSHGISVGMGHPAARQQHQQHQQQPQPLPPPLPLPPASRTAELQRLRQLLLGGSTSRSSSSSVGGGSRSRLSAAEKVRLIQRFISSFTYNQTLARYFTTTLERPLSAVLETARYILHGMRPIRCVEAVFAAVALTMAHTEVDRYTLRFKTRERTRDQICRHMVLAVRIPLPCTAPPPPPPPPQQQKRHRAGVTEQPWTAAARGGKHGNRAGDDAAGGGGYVWGAIGLSRQPNLMTKECSYPSLAALLEEFCRSYPPPGYPPIALSKVMHLPWGLWLPDPTGAGCTDSDVSLRRLLRWAFDVSLSRHRYEACGHDVLSASVGLPIPHDEWSAVPVGRQPRRVCLRSGIDWDWPAWCVFLSRNNEWRRQRPGGRCAGATPPSSPPPSHPTSSRGSSSITWPRRRV
jgi:hypothetical protein